MVAESLSLGREGRERQQDDTCSGTPVIRGGGQGLESAPPQYGREEWGLTDYWDRHSIAGDPLRELSEVL